ncbi:hypothetical protein BLOT_003010 [Blomia tropicalis]|nr:hypothetical protein BLOT_003010 [Blomia tropicalis]
MGNKMLTFTFINRDQMDIQYWIVKCKTTKETSKNKIKKKKKKMKKGKKLKLTKEKTIKCNSQHSIEKRWTVQKKSETALWLRRSDICLRNEIANITVQSGKPINDKHKQSTELN